MEMSIDFNCTVRFFVGMIQSILAYALVTLLGDVPEDAAHELVMMQGAGLFGVISMIGITKSDSLIGSKLDLRVFERTAFDITGQVADHAFAVRVRRAEMGAPFDPK